jgi:hypothetical protein
MGVQQMRARSWLQQEVRLWQRRRQGHLNWSSAQLFGWSVQPRVDGGPPPRSRSPPELLREAESQSGQPRWNEDEIRLWGRSLSRGGQQTE